MFKKDLLKYKWPYMLMMSISILMVELMLKVINVNTYTKVMVFIFMAFPGVLSISWEIIDKNRYYSRIMKALKNLDKKYLLADVIEKDNFTESAVIFDIVKECNKSMNDEVGKYKKLNKSYREYIEMWIHEIKTPIASAKLILHNNPSEVSLSVDEEIDKIENYVEQALYYAKSSSVEKDYIIKKTSGIDMINSSIRKNAKALIENKVRLQLPEKDITVYTDKKWMEFIIGQILSNSIKYMIHNPKIIKISLWEEKNKAVMEIEDSGVGISEKDAVKVFEKGFTGENGRKFGKSTGIGLYLCRELCTKMGLNISLSSKEGEGTKVTIVMPKRDML